MTQRSCDNCRYNDKRKRCLKCITSDKIIHSKFKAKHKLLEIFRREMAKWKELEELMESMKEHKENDMEYKTKEELQSSIEKMETELAKMKEALKMMEEPFWKPLNSEHYYYIDNDFCVYYTSNTTHTDARVIQAFNCFKTENEAKEAARDLKTLFMLYRLSSKSMEREKQESYLLYYGRCKNWTVI